MHWFIQKDMCFFMRSDLREWDRRTQRDRENDKEIKRNGVRERDIERERTKCPRFVMSKSQFDLMLCNRINIVLVIAFDLIVVAFYEMNSIPKLQTENHKHLMQCEKHSYHQWQTKSSQSKVNPFVIIDVCIWISMELH